MTVIEETNKYIFIFDEEREIDPFVVENTNPEFNWVECFKTEEEAREYINNEFNK